jgi:integrase/recombinase XerD
VKLEVAVEEYLAALGSERGLAANTLAAYRRDLAQYRTELDAAGVDDLDDVAAEHVASFVGDLTTSGAASSTVRRKIAAVRGFHRFAVAEEMTTSDPTATLDAPRPERTLPKALTVEEIIRLLETPRGDGPSVLRDRALLEFLYASGARVSETTRLDVVDLDLEGRSALVTGKGSKQRHVPLGSPAVDALGAYLPARMEMKGGRRDVGAVFLNARGGRLSRQGVFRIVRKHALDAGLDPGAVSPHVLRHSAATHMVEGGADLRTVQEILGHASISTTQIYTRVSPRHLYEVFVTSHPRSGRSVG